MIFSSLGIAPKKPMKTTVMKWAILLGSLVALGLTSCGSSNKLVGEKPAEKPKTPASRLVGNADGSVDEQVWGVTTLSHSIFGKLYATETPQVFKSLSGHFYSVYNDPEKGGWVVKPLTVPEYGWLKPKQVSPATRGITKPTPPPAPPSKKTATGVATKAPVKESVASQKPPSTPGYITEEEGRGLGNYYVQ